MYGTPRARSRGSPRHTPRSTGERRTGLAGAAQTSPRTGSARRDARADPRVAQPMAGAIVGSRPTTSTVPLRPHASPQIVRAIAGFSTMGRVGIEPTTLGLRGPQRRRETRIFGRFDALKHALDTQD
jgi:hypothetical protein